MGLTDVAEFTLGAASKVVYYGFIPTIVIYGEPQPGAAAAAAVRGVVIRWRPPLMRRASERRAALI